MMRFYEVFYREYAEGREKAPDRGAVGGETEAYSVGLGVGVTVPSLETVPSVQWTV